MIRDMRIVDPARSYARLLAGQYSAAGVLPPVSGPSVYCRIARAALEHGLDPLGDPEGLVRAEGLTLAWGPTPGRAGLHFASTIVMPWTIDPLERALTIHHERAHHWMQQLGAPHHSEADVMWLTCEFVWPSWLRRSRRPEHSPGWLVGMLGVRAA
jgi:hypothetical protein